jgi:hypothetical protein
MGWYTYILFPRKIKSAARLLVSPLKQLKERQIKAPLYTRERSNLDPEIHLKEAVQWLCRAQDFGTDRGVSYGADFGVGFLPSYPETTGYIICTMLDMARHYGKPELRERAIEMGKWEAEIQLDAGAVMGGMFNTNPTPAVFNTGMVLLGWADLYRETGSSLFKTAGQRAGDWLLEMQEPNGNWIRGNSKFANSTTTVYNVKAAWGLAEMGHALGAPNFIQAAEKNAEFAVSKQRPNGWFSDCCLEDAQNPLLHTIAYTMQGLVGIGKLTGRRDFVDAAARTADSLCALMDETGFMPGKINAKFHGAASWCCLTGTAQSSIVWSELAHLTENNRYRDAALLANRYLMARHDIGSIDPSIRGGLAGSWPVWGDYGQYKILNWATKFFIDALMAQVTTGARQGYATAGPA